MAMEAVSRVKKYSPAQDNKPTFSFRSVNILSALVVQGGDQEIELFTTMYPEKISTASASGIWYTFMISSVSSGTAVSHCTGNISVTLSAASVAGTTFVDATGYDTWSMGRWYEKLASEGLCFGPTFQTLTSMRTEKSRTQPKALSTTKVYQRIPKSADSGYPGVYYAMHPLVIDACLQAAIMGGTGGQLDELHAYLPVFFDNLHITAPDTGLIGSDARIHSYSHTTGFATKKINVTLRDSNDSVLIHMSNARLSLYTGKMENAENAVEPNRHPTLRVIWKPDISRFDPGQKFELDAYIEQFLSDHYDKFESNTVGAMAALMDLAGHRNPRIRILEIEGDCDCKSKQWLELLDEKTDFPRMRTWHRGNFVDGELNAAPHNALNTNKKISLGGEGPKDWDVVLLPQVSIP